MSDLAAWNSFFIIIGSSAGALIGLQFVVMTLIAERTPPHAAEAGPAFATPTIVHFGAVLLLSAIQSAPWHDIMFVAAILGLMGLGGVVYIIDVARKMRAQTAYKPDLPIGCTMLCCLWWHMQCSLYRHLQLNQILSRLCLALGQPHCCCFSSEFITPGIALSTLRFTIKGIQNYDRR